MGGFQFTINRDATCLWITYDEPYTLEHVARILLNPALCFCLRMREIVCLHASAIVRDNRALLIAGTSGAGKSTTASLFALQHHPVLSDDVSALFIHDNEIYVQPGYPLLRLWPTSMKALLGDDEILPTIMPDSDKRYLDLDVDGCEFVERAIPVGAVYILMKRSKELTITPLRATQALMTLMNNTYLDYLLDNHLRAVDMSLLAHLAEKIPVREIAPLDDLTRLPDLYSAILRDFYAFTPALEEVSTQK